MTWRLFQGAVVLVALTAFAERAIAGLKWASTPEETPALGFDTNYVPCEGAASQPGVVRALLMDVASPGTGIVFRGTSNDVTLIQDVLRRRASGAQVTRLTEPGAGEMASGLRRLVEATRCRDFVFLHFSGNGVPYNSTELGREDVVLVAHGGQRGTKTPDGLRGKDIAAAVLAMRNRGAFVMVTIDACYAKRLRLTQASAESLWRVGGDSGDRPASRLMPGAGGMAAFLAPDVAEERQFETGVYGALSFAIASGLTSGARTVRELGLVIDSTSQKTLDRPSVESTEPDQALLVAGSTGAGLEKEHIVGGTIKLLQPAPTKGQKLLAGVDIEVTAEAPGADRLVAATVNDAPAQLDGRRLKAHIRLAPGARNITIFAVDAKQRPHSSSFEVVVNEDQPDRPRGRSVAVLIANAHYVDRKWQALDFPELEIRDMQRTLQDSYGFEATSLKDGEGKEISLVLVDQTKTAIIATMETVAGLLGPNDQLLVYYSGHGWMPPNMGEAFWVPRDAKGESLFTYISSDEISKTFAQSSVGHWLVISDSCRSGCMWGRCGNMKAPVPASVAESDPAYYQGVARINRLVPSRNAFTSGANEDVPSSRIFNSWLLKHLKAPTKTAFTGSQLHNWIQAKLAGDARPGATGQVSLYFVIPAGGGDKGGDFAFFHSDRKK